MVWPTPCLRPPPTKISTINNMDYNDINQHSTNLTNINSQNQSPIHPITLSYSQNKQTLNTTIGNISTPNNLPTPLQRNSPCSSRIFSPLSTCEEL